MLHISANTGKGILGIKGSTVSFVKVSSRRSVPAVAQHATLQIFHDESEARLEEEKHKYEDEAKPMLLEHA